MPCGLFNSCLGYRFIIFQSPLLFSLSLKYISRMFFFSFFPGHGLKMVVGKILSQLALVEKVTYDILPLRLSRFLVVKEVKSSLKSKEMMLQYHTELAYNHGISK